MRRAGALEPVQHDDRRPARSLWLPEAVRRDLRAGYDFEQADIGGGKRRRRPLAPPGIYRHDVAVAESPVRHERGGGWRVHRIREMNTAPGRWTSGRASSRPMTGESRP